MAAAIGILASSAGLAAASPTVATAGSSVRITSLPATAFTTTLFSLNATILPGTSALPFEVQVSTPDRRAWRSLGTHRALEYVVQLLKFTSPNVYSLRVVVPSAGLVSAVKTVTVTPPYPYTSIAKRTFDIRPDAKNEQRITVGTPIVESSATSCSIPNLAGSCVTDTPVNGRFVTVPLTIHQVKGRGTFAPFNFQLTIGKTTYSPVVEDTGHGTPLQPGSQRAGGTTKGSIVFDTPVPKGAKFGILGVKGTLAL